MFPLRLISIACAAILLACCDEYGNPLDEQGIDKLMRSVLIELVNSGEAKLIRSNNRVSIYKVENNIVICPPEPEFCAIDQLDHSLNETN